MVGKRIKTVFLLLILLNSIEAISQQNTIDSIKAQIESSKDKIKIINSYNRLANLASRKDPIATIKYGKQAFQLARDIQYNQGLADAYLYIGRGNENLNNFDTALENYFTALLLYENLEMQEKIAITNYRIGVIFKNTSNYYKAQEYCQNALLLMEEIGDKKGISLIYNTLGSIFKYLGDNDKALEYYKKSMEIDKLYLNEGPSAAVLNNTGIIYDRKREFNEALSYYFKSLKIRRKIMDSLGIAHSYNNIGTVMLELQDYDSALICFETSLKIKKQLANRKGQMSTYNNLGDYFYRKGNYKRAITYADSSLQISKELNVPEYEKNNFILLSDIYSKKKMYDSSLYYYKLYKKVFDSIKGPKTILKVAKLENEYGKTKAKKLIALKEQKERLLKIIFFGTTVAFLVIIILIYRNLRNKYKNNKLKQANLEMEKKNLLAQIEVKDKELACYIIHLSEKNESLNSTKKLLQSVEKKLKEENKSLIRSAVNKLNTSINNNIWEEFDMRFVNVYNDFYDNLLKKHPDITPNEKRLAAFLKLDMSSKEISMITKQSVHSITVARTRLRKKLGLSNTDTSLVSYLSTY